MPRGPGKKLFMVDEVWQWQTPQGIPPELSMVVQTGREENLEFVCATQLPHKVHASIIGQATEMVCFRLDERLALKCMDDNGLNSETIRNLELGSFISYNRITRASLAGKVF